MNWTAFLERLSTFATDNKVALGAFFAGVLIGLLLG
jgi:hypothetical protein